MKNKECKTAVRSSFSSTRNSFIFKSWWMVAFLLACCAIYLHVMQKKQQVYSHLNQRLSSIEKELLISLQKKEDLLLQIESQKDPIWIEMILMKKLGLVPEGQTKVFFDQKYE